MFLINRSEETTAQTVTSSDESYSTRAANEGSRKTAMQEDVEGKFNFDKCHTLDIQNLVAVNSGNSPWLIALFTSTTDGYRPSAKASELNCFILAQRWYSF